MVSARFSLVVVAALALVAWATGCPSNSFNANLPPSHQFYFPTGLVHVDSAVIPNGVLFVANANFDKRFSTGSLMAVNLSNVGLPPFGQPVAASGPIQLPALNTGDAGIVLISSFAGEMAALDLGQGRTRLFIPSRSEGMRFQAIDADPVTSATGQPVLHCSTPEGVSAADCGSGAPSLSPVEFELGLTGLPRAPGPFGVTVRPRACPTGECPVGTCQAGRCMTTNDAGLAEPFADVFVTHISQADSPLASSQNLRGYLVRLDSQNPTVGVENFINLGGGASSSVVSGQRFIYASGRLSASSNLLRLVDPSSISLDGGTLVYTSALEQSFRASEARGLALSSDEHRVYIASRVPDALLVASIDNPLAQTPAIQVARSVPLPSAPNEVRAIARPGRSDLVIITATGAQSVVLYDDDVGDVVGQVTGVGLSPFDVAVDIRGAGARLYVSDFDDGRIAVIDVPDLNRPQDARLVAHLGAQQLCLTQGQRNPQLCDAGTPVVSQ